MQFILDKLFNAQVLTQQESHLLFSTMIRGGLTESQLAGALISMKMRGEEPNEIVGAALACLENAQPFPRPNYDFCDIVGTGGDHSNSINISTASAFVAAECGLKVAKHGNRSISSRAGSSDLLASFGVPLDMTPSSARRALDEVGICFLFAPQYHQGFRHAAPIRSQLKTRTLFNILGPLINPAKPPIALIGVYDPKLIIPIAKTLQLIGYKRAAVVHSSGIDEVALHGPIQVAELNQDEILTYQLTAQDFGLPSYSSTELIGGSVEKNHQLITTLLQGNGKPAHTNTVAANVALLMKLNNYEDLKTNTDFVLQVIRSGKAYQRLTMLANRKEFH
ncbi:anthranilate phosphoribosyltransferase [Arsenophonus sp. aPb]|uniref:anthranilate phosphoribosyltransferase n=1 Tax=Arsenophonus sp. aPb TaxID=3041619 RepID=UPI00246947D6|nr:anthranilate phosphoribosyltransferase [Arsenophonus sp. aPb]WGL97045.1 anthranilate phosphoribosyltransferase [Arsenophonus sp. aPb]